MNATAMTPTSDTLTQNTLIVNIHRALLAIVAVLLLFQCAVYVVYAVNLINFPFDYDQGEGFELVDVMMFSEGEFPYADIETYPFYGSIYPPLYHVLLVPFAWLFGAEYWYGRLFSFLTTLISAWAISTAVYREGKNRPIAIISGLAFLSSAIVYHIGPLFRQHISMVMFEMLAVLVLAHTNEIEDTKKRRQRLALGFGLLLAAGYTKQLAAFTALAAIAFIFIRNPRRAMVWGAGFTVVGAGIFIGLTIGTSGHWWTQTIVANVKDFFPQQAIGLLRVWFVQHAFLIIPASLYVLYEIYFSRISIYSLWFIAVTVFSAMSAGTWGAGDSYYATSIAALCVLSGIFASRTLNRSWTFNENPLSHLIIIPFKRFSPQLGVVGLIVIPMFYMGYVASVFHMPTHGAVFTQIADILDIEDNTGRQFYDPDGYTTLAYAQIGHLTTQEDIDGGNYIVELINEIPNTTPVLSEEAAFSLLTERDVLTNPVVLMILSWVNAFDSSELVDMVRNQEFGLIVLRAQFYPTEVLLAITEFYEEDERVAMNGFSYMILRPRPLQTYHNNSTAN